MPLVGQGMLMFLRCRLIEVKTRRLQIQRTFLVQPRHRSASDHHSFQRGRNCHPRERGERCTTHLDLDKTPAVFRYLASVSEVLRERRESQVP